MKTVPYARYVLAIASGGVDESTRAAYLESLSDGERGYPLLGTILNTAAKMTAAGELPAGDAMDTVRGEYDACGLENRLGPFSQFEPLVEAVFQEIANGSEPMARCGRLTNAADGLGGPVKGGVYLAAVNQLVSVEMILRDRDYAKSVIDCAAGIDRSVPGVEEFRGLAETAFLAPVLNNRSDV